MQAHFVTFFSPGTFVSETTDKPIAAWNTDAALALMADVTERYGAKPYGFRFTTRGREENELDSKVVDRSPMYFVGGKVETREEIIARNDPKEEILRFNLDANDIERVWVSTEGWRVTQPLNADDIVLPKP